MSLIKKLFFLILCYSATLFGANVEVTTFYGKTGGIVGVLNTTEQVVNGRTICSENPTIGCDFGDDPGFSNNGTVDDPSDDSYSGDLVVRTNDSFQVVAGWTWNGEAGGSKERVVIKGTLPSTGTLPDGSTGTTKSYTWDRLPSSCLADESSISADKQTMTCVRFAFDKNDVGTYSEDLPFNVIVKGETLSKTKPGDITFEISAEDATTKSDDTDGYSLTVTAAPRWNLQKSMYTAITGYEHNGVKGWLMDYKFYIEVDEVNGEIDNASALVGNESMGRDATFTFKDDMSNLAPNAKLVGCSFKGRFVQQDGYVGSADPLTYSGEGSIWGDSYPERKIAQTADEREIICTQSGSTIDVTAKHIDATLTNYPKLDYRGYKLPVNRGIAVIGSIYVFVPLDDVKPKDQGGDNPNSEGWLKTKNTLTNFDPVTPTGNENFGGERESEKDNSYSYTLYYSRGSFSKYYRGESSSVWTYPGGAATYRSGDGMATQGYEFSTVLVSNNTGGTNFTQEKMCDVVDAYRLDIQDIGNNQYYNIIKSYYGDAYHFDNQPVMYRIWNGSGLYDNNKVEAEEPYVFEYASTYEDDSWLPSRGGDQSVAHTAEVIAECSADDTKWFATSKEARDDANGIGTVTKVRVRLRDGVEHIPGSYVYIWLNHKIRSHDLKTGLPLENGDEITNFAANAFNDNAWSGPSYITENFPEPPSGYNGDRIIYTGPKARVIKNVDKVALSAGDSATFNLQISFTNDTGIEEYGYVKVTDLLPKGLKYVAKSVTEPYSEPVIGSCEDVLDLNSSDTPCNDIENQVLIWDLGTRRAGEVFPDINYSTVVGVEVNDGTIRNVVKIEADTDASPISQRKSDVGMSVTIPASINIVKSTEENPEYPSLRERTTEAKDINFVMDMRNGKAGDITDLDVIDILPFKGDGNDGAIKFNTLELKRKVDTSFHGSSIFNKAELVEHPLSSTRCDLDANGGVKYYYTKADPTTINIAPTVGDANIIGGESTIWCEGDENGPNGCNGLSNADVTAVRARGPRMEESAICQFKVSLSVKDNLAGDNYSNSAGASATGITLPVLSNSLAVPVVGSSLGDKVWYDKNSNGIQDEGEEGVSDIKVRLLDGSGNPVKNPANPTEDYVVTTDANGAYSFGKLNSGKYTVEFEKPVGFLVSPKVAGGNRAVDSNINSDGKTDIIDLGVDENIPTIDAGFFTPVISGNIFDDGNGDGTINGTKIASADATPLFATLLDANGAVLASTPIAADGSYAFDAQNGVRAKSNYSVVLSKNENATTSKLPTDWNHADGEHIGTSAGTDGNANGLIAVSVLEADVPQVNFGINEKPVAHDKIEASQLNPGADVKVNVPDLNVTDREDGRPATITIIELPTNGILYYNGELVTMNKAIESVDPSKFTIDPDDGDQTVLFKYTTTDKVGVTSEPATVTLPFSGLKISGNVYDDGSGDATVNGTKFNNPSETILYATLLDASGRALATTSIAGDGSYEFKGEDGIKPNTTYSVVLGIEANATEASLPTNWNHADGEHIGTDEGLDGAADGEIEVSVVETDILEVNFGINKKPEAVDKEEPTQPNPGGDAQVVVPALGVTDKEDGTPTTITITTVPTNGKLYYNGAEVVAGDKLLDFDSTKFTVDPDNGDQTIVFNYATTDRADVVSDEAKVTLPFSDIQISGKLFDDGNNNGNVDGNRTAKADDIQLYVTLVDANGDAVASKPLSAEGTYSFSNADGVTPNTNYTMVLTDALNKVTPKLPANWNNADGENIGLTGVDGTADGVVTVEVKTAHISEINFGINKKPVADNKIESAQFNPGSDVQVNVPTLTVSDKEDGTPAIVTIRTLPENATLYYGDVEVTVGMNIDDLTLLSVDPDDGDQTVIFTYTSTDVAGMVSNPATVTMPFKGIQIAGNVFNDGNADGTVNGTPIASPSATQLYATLLDSNGTAIATTSISEDGRYSFGNKDGVLPNHSYSVVLSTTANSTTADLPLNWNNADGEHIGATAGLDNAPDGVIEVTVEEVDVLQVNFGINKKPVAGDNSGEEQLNPGTDVQVNVIDLKVSDDEDTTPSTVTIKRLPTNGILYYNGSEVTEGQVIKDFDNSKLTLDPENGTLTVSFTYTTTDESGVESEEATIAMPFKGLKISGNIFNDGNSDGIVNGKLISSADEVVLYAVLLDGNGKFMAREAIKADGSYDFDGVDGVVPNSRYVVVLSSDANGITAMLPSSWTNADGEHIGSDAGLDGVADGTVEVEVKIVDVSQVNLGINKIPVADDKIEPEQLNTSRDAQYAVPTLTVSDNEDASPVIIIRTLPTNAKLYYEGNLVELNATIVDPSKLTIDPDDGDQNVTFTYISTDRTGAVSNPATVIMPFKGLKISGFIFADGNNDGIVNGTEIFLADSIQLYATLINDSNETLATVAIDSNGSYMFENKDGLYPNNNYQVILSTEANATRASLPDNWNNADGEHIGRDRGLDDSANGVIDVNVITRDIPEVNFGINKRPVVKNVTSVVQSNPGADKQVDVIDLGISDNEDGSPKTVTIVSLPTEGVLYYDGVAVKKGQIIPNFDNKLLTVDPKNGATNIIFDYTTTDKSGWESKEARVIMPFAAVAPAENFTVVDDTVPASLEGAVTTINVLENDNGLANGDVVIHLLNTNNGSILWSNGTAVGSATIETQDSVVVPGEGVWTVSGGTVVFTAEESYTGIPTPIYYVVEDDQGNQTNAAQVAIISNCVCDTYEKSVSAMNLWSMLLTILFISTIGVLLARREFN
jgi:uncharacterized repeat protein (TIGR01451 family)